MRSQVVGKILTGITGVVLLHLLAVTAASDAFRKLPYLIYTGDPTAMSVMWQTYDEEISSLVLRSSGGEELARLDGVDVSGSSSTLFLLTGLRRADLTGLAPATSYSYAVTARGEVVTGSFRTASPLQATSATFYAISDTQGVALDPASSADACGMSNLIQAAKEDAQAAATPPFLLHGGDWISGGSTYLVVESQWDRLFEALSPVAGSMPALGVRGNHDLGYSQYGRHFATSLFGRYWSSPYADSSRSCYSFDWGPVHVAVAGAVDLQAGGGTVFAPISAAAAQWLVKDLEDHRERPWAILLVHDFQALGPYMNPMAGIRDRMGQMMSGGWPWPEDTLYDVLAARGVDLIVSGHWHSHDFFAWDCDKLIENGRVRIGDKLPILQLSSVDDHETWYRFDVAGDKMLVRAMSSDPEYQRTHEVLRRP